jgi:hypothetical protein
MSHVKPTQVSDVNRTTPKEGVMKIEIHTRDLTLVNTDPQRRCYNGCHFSSELRWSTWTKLETTTAEDADSRIQFWQELN